MSPCENRNNVSKMSLKRPICSMEYLQSTCKMIPQCVTVIQYYLPLFYQNWYRSAQIQVHNAKVPNAKHYAKYLMPKRLKFKFTVICQKPNYYPSNSHNRYSEIYPKFTSNLPEIEVKFQILIYNLESKSDDAPWFQWNSLKVPCETQCQTMWNLCQKNLNTMPNLLLTFEWSRHFNLD